MLFDQKPTPDERRSLDHTGLHPTIVVLDVSDTYMSIRGRTDGAFHSWAQWRGFIVTDVDHQIGDITYMGTLPFTKRVGRTSRELA